MPHKVTLHVYDLSRGMARQLSPMLLGKYIDGIWHTGIVVYGTEYFYGQGIQQGYPANTPFGAPHEVIELGETTKEQGEFLAYLQQLSSRFNMYTYHLLENNCNDFTRESSMFLVGRPIPAHITGLPSEVMATPFGAMIRPLIDQMFTGAGGAPESFMQPPGTPSAAAAFSGSPRTLGQELPVRSTPIVFRNCNFNGLFSKLYPVLSECAIADRHVTLVRQVESFLRSKTPLPHPPSVYLEALFSPELLGRVPTPQQFPIWDILRLLSLEPAFVEQLATTFRDRLLIVVDTLVKHVEAQDKTFALTSLRLLSNVICNAQSFLRSLDSPYAYKVVELACEAMHAPAPFLRMVAAAMANNIMLSADPSVLGEASIELLSALVHWIAQEDNKETVLYMLRAIDMILQKDTTSVEIARGLGFDPIVFLDAQKYGEDVVRLAGQIKL
eukprot:ANDGO_06904.mRNA.1 DeSI-like protein At4g17486